MRLDLELINKKLVQSRSRGEDYIRRGLVLVNGNVVTKPSFSISESDKVTLSDQSREQYVSRAGEKLASVAKELGLDFTDKLVLDVGSSTGGFTDYSLKHGSKKVIAIDVGTNQLHPTLHGNPKIELHEKTDIRDFIPNQKPDLILVDVSFISVRMILAHIAEQMSAKSELVVMLKPQFEAGKSQINRGVIKNSKVRREVIHEFEIWVQNLFKIVGKADSGLAGSKGNVERFYLLKRLR